MERLDIKRVQVQDALSETCLSTGQPLLVGQVMTAAPSCIQADTSVLELVKLLHAKEFRHLLVTDEQGRLRGVVSDRDVIRCFGPGKYPQAEILAQIPAERVMSVDVVTIQPAVPLHQAVEIMMEQGISCLPVVVDEHVVGILTNTDIQLVLHELMGSLPNLQFGMLAGTSDVS